MADEAFPFINRTFAPSGTPCKANSSTSANAEKLKSQEQDNTRRTEQHEKGPLLGLANSLA
jgi:hypothetical protein